MGHQLAPGRADERIGSGVDFRTEMAKRCRRIIEIALLAVRGPCEKALHMITVTGLHMVSG